MNNIFKSDEKLYRAVYPPEIREMFWKSNGEVSSAAFYDVRGCSVDRGDYRTDDEVVQDMRNRFTGRIVSVTVAECESVEAKIVYMPSKADFRGTMCKECPYAKQVSATSVFCYLRGTYLRMILDCKLLADFSTN